MKLLTSITTVGGRTYVGIPTEGTEKDHVKLREFLTALVGGFAPGDSGQLSISQVEAVTLRTVADD